MATQSSTGYMTLGEVARLTGVEYWQVQSAANRGLLPGLRRIGAYRVSAVDDLPAVKEALRQAGYLADVADVASIQAVPSGAVLRGVS